MYLRIPRLSLWYCNIYQNLRRSEQLQTNHPLLFVPSVPLPPSRPDRPAATMSSHAPKKKKTVAQVRAEKEQHEQNVALGRELLRDVSAGINQIDKAKIPGDEALELLGKANRACALLQNHATFGLYAWALQLRASVHNCWDSTIWLWLHSEKPTRSSWPRHATGW